MKTDKSSVHSGCCAWKDTYFILKLMELKRQHENKYDDHVFEHWIIMFSVAIDVVTCHLFNKTLNYWVMMLFCVFYNCLP